MPSPEELAGQFVGLALGGPGGCHRVCLTVPGGDPVRLGSHLNPTVARDEAEAVRRFVAAVIRAADAAARTHPDLLPPARHAGLEPGP